MIWRVLQRPLMLKIAARGSIVWRNAFVLSIVCWCEERMFTPSPDWHTLAWWQTEKWEHMCSSNVFLSFYSKSWRIKHLNNNAQTRLLSLFLFHKTDVSWNNSVNSFYLPFSSLLKTCIFALPVSINQFENKDILVYHVAREQSDSSSSAEDFISSIYFSILCNLQKHRNKQIESYCNIKLQNKKQNCDCMT